MTACDPVVNDTWTNSKAIGNFADGQFTGAFWRGCRDVMPISNPAHHAPSETLTLGTEQAVLIEGGCDLPIGHVCGQRTNPIHQRLRITDLVRGRERELGRQVFHRTSLPADVQHGFAFRAPFFHGDILDEQTEHPLAILGRSRLTAPELGQVFGQSPQLSFLFIGQLQALSLPRLVKLFLSGLEFFEGIVPASFKSAGHQSVGWINFFVAPLGQLGLVLQALDPHAPLLIDSLAATLQFLHRPKSNLDLFWTEDFQNAITDGFVNQVSLDPHAFRGIVGVCLATGAFVNGINPCMTGVARRQSASAMPTEKSEEHTSELQSPCNLVCRLLLEKKKMEPDVPRYVAHRCSAQTAVTPTKTIALNP